VGDRVGAAALRQLLEDGSDEQLARFLDSYALGDVASQLIALPLAERSSGVLRDDAKQCPEWFGLVSSNKSS